MTADPTPEPDYELVPELPRARVVRPRVTPGVPPRLAWVVRILLVGMALVFTVVLTLAFTLNPYDADGNPRTMATHTQLGLPPCNFVTLTGKPCPACGMTTAFSLSVRGRWVEAWRANPAGSVIAPVLGLVLLPWLFVASTSGRTRPFRTVDEPLVAAVLIGVALALASWGFSLLRRLW